MRALHHWRLTCSDVHRPLTVIWMSLAFKWFAAVQLDTVAHFHCPQLLSEVPSSSGKYLGLKQSNSLLLTHDFACTAFHC